ncbi:tetratricopeptide repeat protein [Calothrix sp. FACHB-1219]|uniref:tetratricopeptide repeat protein n=1 Tax=unclassified Calothrix TaxID=2619626 RepID=UPI0016872107|nr:MULTISPECIES: tetratricopeptide repeat protein [unclassified Calothrix]MBD2201348.1 tetratricopeptide repeat protein [Calothrix sp. FACHB-168]MBD2215782.1 tetratricopeptide repeat protein [Calothrix sp. FACHB-1219]
MLNEGFSDDGELDDEQENQDAYDDLIVSIESEKRGLNLLIAVCDDAIFRDDIIDKYEAELQQNFRPYRVMLARQEPSLKSALNQLVQQEEYLRQKNPAVITMMGAEQLYFLKLGDEQSEQEKFFGYLQWTREGLREFPFAIVLWVTNQILFNLIKKAPDFWSWRNGVFRFVSKKTNAIAGKELEPIRFVFRDTELASIDTNENYSFCLPIQDLQRLIKKVEQQKGSKDPSLATLYSRLGDIYRSRLDRGESQNYQKEQELAIKYWRQAIDLNRELDLQMDLAANLNNLAGFYRAIGRYQEAEPLYQQALELTQNLLGDNHPCFATSLNNLAGLYKSRGQYSKAELLYQQALELRKRLLGDHHPDVAASLNNLALLYDQQERYHEAEPLYLQSLEIRKHLLGENHPSIAIILNNLALLYYHQKRYGEAEPLSLQAIELDKRFLGDENSEVATDLHNLALIYRAQGRYQEAESLFLQSLEIKQRLLQKVHPLLADTIYALGYMYREQGRFQEAEPLCVKALELDKQLLGDNHPYVAESLNNLAEIYRLTGRYSEAQPLYEQALDICQLVWGVNHPHTVTVRDNLADISDRLSSLR